MNKNTEANKLFNEFMFPTKNGTLVINRDDFNTIIKTINRKWSEELRKATRNNSFKRMFEDYDEVTGD